MLDLTTPQVLDDLAKALQAFCEEANAKTHREAARAYAMVDWVEPDIERHQKVLSAYHACLYHLGESLGFKPFEKLTEMEIKLLDLDNS